VKAYECVPEPFLEPAYRTQFSPITGVPYWHGCKEPFLAKSAKKP
jgi:hypothetical protein